MEDLSKDRLMRLQVEQLEKEKKDLNERLRIAAKRIDHIERAYRKEERPLLAQDYAEQQAADRATFEALQKARIENSQSAHNRAVASKKRLNRMQEEFRVYSKKLLAARTEEYQRRQAVAAKKEEEEKNVRRQARAAQKEEERKKQEEAEAVARRAEEERLRAEAGVLSLLHVSDRLLTGALCCRSTCGGGSRSRAKTRGRRASRGAASTTRSRTCRGDGRGAQEGTAGARSGGTCAPAQDGAGSSTTQYGRGWVAIAYADKRRESGAVARRAGSTQDWQR